MKNLFRSKVFLLMSSVAFINAIIINSAHIFKGLSVYQILRLYGLPPFLNSAAAPIAEPTITFMFLLTINFLIAAVLFAIWHISLPQIEKMNSLKWRSILMGSLIAYAALVAVLSLISIGAFCSENPFVQNSVPLYLWITELFKFMLIPFILSLVPVGIGLAGIGLALQLSKLLNHPT